jgi:hypothetical protein
MSEAYDAAVEIREALPTERERRRYALLQASAVIFAEAMSRQKVDAGICVHAAEALLAEIEKREKAEERP